MDICGWMRYFLFVCICSQQVFFCDVGRVLFFMDVYYHSIPNLRVFFAGVIWVAGRTRLWVCGCLLLCMGKRGCGLECCPIIHICIYFCVYIYILNAVSFVCVFVDVWVFDSSLRRWWGLHRINLNYTRDSVSYYSRRRNFAGPGAGILCHQHRVGRENCARQVGCP